MGRVEGKVVVVTGAAVVVVVVVVGAAVVVDDCAKAPCARNIKNRTDTAVLQVKNDSFVLITYSS